MITVDDIMEFGVGMPNREEFERFARDLLSFPVSQSADGKVSYVRPDHFQHRIAAYTAPAPVLNYVGFDIGGPQQLVAWQTKLHRKASVGATAAQRSVLNRHVADFIEFIESRWTPSGFVPRLRDRP